METEEKEQEKRDEEEKFGRLVDIVATLRGEGGCPWDRAQTHDSLIVCLEDEKNEVEEAIANRDADNLCEELGDLLLQVVFHAQLAKEEGLFTMSDVLDGVSEKMIRRHPHVFGDLKIESPEECVDLWQKIKAEERGGQNGAAGKNP